MLAQKVVTPVPMQALARIDDIPERARECGEVPRQVICDLWTRAADLPKEILNAHHCGLRFSNTDAAVAVVAVARSRSCSSHATTSRWLLATSISKIA